MSKAKSLFYFVITRPLSKSEVANVQMLMIGPASYFYPELPAREGQYASLGHLPRKCRDVYTKKVKFKLVNFLTPDIVIVWGECLLERKFKVTDKFI